MLRRLFAAIRETLRRYFVAGIVFFAPIAITLWAIVSIVRWLDNLILPRLLRLVLPGQYEPPTIPVVGALFTLLLIVLLGVVARHLFGGEVLRLWERALRRVPVARNIYAAVKQLFEAIFSASAETHFNRVVLVEYPRRGVYALAFTTGPAGGLLQDVTPDHVINCFVPTTPNPTSGFYILVPDHELIELDLSVEEAFKLVMSAGLVSPDLRDPLRRPRPGPDAAPRPAALPEVGGGPRGQEG